MQRRRRMVRALVCDLDGTLLGEPASLRILLNLLAGRDAPLLVCASGRQGFSATALLSEWGVSAARYLIAGVGTELYRRIGKTWTPIGAWPQLQHPWEAQRVRSELRAISTLEPQPIPVTSPYKLSYYAAPEAVDEVRSRLQRASIEATIVYSHNGMLDVLPQGTDKGGAVAWLLQRLQIPMENAVVCGNTANDLSMLRLPCAGIVVGESDAELLEAVPSLPDTYAAAAPCAAGIIEGLQYFGWLRGSCWRTSGRSL